MDEIKGLPYSFTDPNQTFPIPSQIGAIALVPADFTQLQKDASASRKTRFFLEVNSYRGVKKTVVELTLRTVIPSGMFQIDPDLGLGIVFRDEYWRWSDGIELHEIYQGRRSRYLRRLDRSGG